MKLVTYRLGLCDRAGLLLIEPSAPESDGGTVLDIAATHQLARRSAAPLQLPQLPATVLELLDAWELTYPELLRLQEWASARVALLAEAGCAFPANAVQLQAPLPNPRSVRDGYAFRQHVEAARRSRGLPMIPEFDQFPVFYFSNHHAVTGPGPVVVQPLHLERLDFELECAIVIGRMGRNIPAHAADRFIAGFMIMNDWSARELQAQEMKLNLGPAKGKDFATSFGPWLVTPEELADVTTPSEVGNRYALRMRAFVNGEQLSDANLAEMSWTFAQIIERASYGVWLRPGEVIGSGTCGTGCLLELNGTGAFPTPRWLRPGDVVELAIERLGTLRNVIVLEDPASAPSE